MHEDKKKRAKSLLWLWGLLQYVPPRHVLVETLGTAGGLGTPTADQAWTPRGRRPSGGEAEIVRFARAV